MQGRDMGKVATIDYSKNKTAEEGGTGHLRSPRETAVCHLQGQWGRPRCTHESLPVGTLWDFVHEGNQAQGL